MHKIVRISLRHPWRNNRHSPFEFRSNPNERKDIWMIEFGPGMYFFEEFLYKDQSGLSHANCIYLDGFLISWKTASRSLYSNLGAQ